MDLYNPMNMGMGMGMGMGMAMSGNQAMAMAMARNFGGKLGAGGKLNPQQMTPEMTQQLMQEQQAIYKEALKYQKGHAGGAIGSNLPGADGNGKSAAGISKNPAGTTINTSMNMGTGTGASLAHNNNPHNRNSSSEQLASDSKLFKRSSYHVAIAYHIYMKNLNNNGRELSGIDPTYPARQMRDEKKRDVGEDEMVREREREMEYVQHRQEQL